MGVGMARWGEAEPAQEARGWQLQVFNFSGFYKADIQKNEMRLLNAFYAVSLKKR